MLVNVTLDLPKQVYNQYITAAPNRDVTKVLNDRLIACSTYTSHKPLYINDDNRIALEELLGINLNDASEIVKAIEDLVAVRVGKINLNIKPLLLNRLQSRCHGGTFDDFLKDLIIKELEEYVGMR